MYILQFIFILLEVLILFNLLIFVHELGHFLAARWRGLKIERFAIWFGKPIWQKTINGVNYRLGTIPAGGYVALPQMASMDAIEGSNENKGEELPPISALDKIIVAFAGPLFSMLLALVFGVVVWIVGRPVNEGETTTTIGYVLKDSPAEAAGLRAGDKILKVDGHPVTKFGGIGDTVTWRIVRSEGKIVPVTVQRGAEIKTFNTEPVKEKTQKWERQGLREIQILPQTTPLIGVVTKNSPAANAKLQPNDIVLQINGISLHHPAAVAEIIRENPDKPVQLKVRRDSRDFDVTLTPVMPSNQDIPEEKRHPMLGIEWDLGGQMGVDHPDPITQVKASVVQMVNTLSAILSPRSDIKFQHLSGPVGIIRIYYRLFESEQGWRLALWFSVVLNVNLALLNLLPIPVLDGGHITLALVEAIRKKPVPGRLLNIVQTSCAVVIIGYMLYITFYDAQDWPWKRKKNVEIKFAPPSSQSP